MTSTISGTNSEMIKQINNQPFITVMTKLNASLPHHRYSRNQLILLQDAQISRKKPANFSQEYETSEGIWDPDKWFNNLVGVLESKSNERVYSRGRKPDWNESEDKKRARSNADDRSQSVHSSIDNEGVISDDSRIILVPQRGSFNTGCHVNNPLVKNRDFQNSQHQNSDRYRIRDRPYQIREYGNPSYQGKNNEGPYQNRNINHHQSRPYTNEETYEYDLREKGPRRTNYKSRIGKEDDELWTSKRENYYQEEHKGNGDRGRWSKNMEENGPAEDQHYKPNKTNSRKYTGQNINGREPEWFSSGPLTRDDQIELGGFDSIANSISEEKMEIKERMVDNEASKNGEHVEENCVKSFPQKDQLQKYNQQNQQQHQNQQQPLLQLQQHLQQTCQHQSHLQNLQEVSGSNSNIDLNELFKHLPMPPSEQDKNKMVSSRFRNFFNIQLEAQSPEFLISESSPHLPPAPPVYGHQLDTMIDSTEERRIFYNLLERANIVSTHNLNHDKAMMRNLESDLKMILKVGSQNANDLRMLKSNINAPNAIMATDLEAAVQNEGQHMRLEGHTDLFVQSQPYTMYESQARMVYDGQPRHIVDSHSRLFFDGQNKQAFVPKVMQLTDIEPSSPMRGSEINQSAFNKLLGMVQQTDISRQNQILISCQSSLISQNSLTSQSFSKTASPLVFSTVPPSNLATPHAMHFSNNNFLNTSNSSNNPEHKNNPSISSINGMGENKISSSSSLKPIINSATFLPTAVIRQIANEKIQPDNKTMVSDQLRPITNDKFEIPTEGMTLHTQLPQELIMSMVRGQIPFPPPSMPLQNIQQESIKNILQKLQSGGQIVSTQINGSVPIGRPIVKGACMPLNFQAVPQYPLQNQKPILSSHPAQPARILNNQGGMTPLAQMFALQQAMGRGHSTAATYPMPQAILGQKFPQQHLMSQQMAPPQPNYIGQSQMLPTQGFGRSLGVRMPEREIMPPQLALNFNYPPPVPIASEGIRKA